MLDISVEVLVPWQLGSVELWEEWVYDDIQDKLERQLRVEEE